VRGVERGGRPRLWGCGRMWLACLAEGAGSDRLTMSSCPVDQTMLSLSIYIYTYIYVYICIYMYSYLSSHFSLWQLPSDPSTHSQTQTQPNHTAAHPACAAAAPNQTTTPTHSPHPTTQTHAPGLSETPPRHLPRQCLPAPGAAACAAWQSGRRRRW